MTPCQHLYKSVYESFIIIVITRREPYTINKIHLFYRRYRNVLFIFINFEIIKNKS